MNGNENVLLEGARTLEARTLAEYTECASKQDV